MNWRRLKSEAVYWTTRSGRVRLALANRFEKQLRKKWENGDWKTPGIAPENRTSELFVSLTTWRPRLEILPLTLCTLVNQSLRPEAIVVWITAEDLALVSPEVRKAFEPEGVVFRECEDIGPHKKWFYADSLGSDPAIVLADDDTFYRPEWLEMIHRDFQSGKFYTGNRCHRISFSNGRVSNYGNWHKECRDYGKASHLLVATGCDGVAFRSSWIPAEFRNLSTLMSLCPRADDMWLKCAMLAADIKVLKTESFAPVLGASEASDSGLEQVNVHEDMNTKQFLATVDHFDLMPRLINE